ncbi:hypothetical protein C8Q77DRAFT_1043740 [Trametes polyzona]|nr:hypothetical protein C8Q77DRAFT_1043740 [Trametes polyzona]
MLARLSASATSGLVRAAPTSLRRLSPQVRFNSSEAPAQAPAQQPATDSEAQPKKRAIPLADSLGDISISNAPRERSTGNGDRRQNGKGNRDPNRQRQPRPNGERNNNGNNNNNRGQFAARGQRNDRRPAREQGQAQAAPGGDASQQQQNQRDQRRSPRPRREEDDEPINIPAPREIELGNLEDLFGAPTPSSPAPNALQSANDTKPLSPSQHRVQALLERTAGDYSRYVPKVLPTTNVKELSPLALGEFILSKRRDVGLPSRKNALAVIGKFPATNTVPKDAPPS